VQPDTDTALGRLQRLRDNFEAEGHRVSARDDVDEAAIAWLLGCKLSTCANRRSAAKRRGDNSHPPSYRLPCGQRYALSALQEWLDSLSRQHAA